MLPILPALLLLILQGPSSIEKMALDGRLPAALEAVSRQMEAQDHRSGSIERADATVLASLLALSGDPNLSHALIQLLSLDQGFTCPGGEPPIRQEESIERGRVESDPVPIRPQPCLDSQRSRDGPV